MFLSWPNISDETVAKGPLEDILHETLTAEYVPQSQRKRPKRLKQPGVCYMSDGYSKARTYEVNYNICIITNT